MLTPGMTPPVVSAIVPGIVPRSLCAKAAMEMRQRQNRTPTERMTVLLFLNCLKLFRPGVYDNTVLDFQFAGAVAEAVAMHSELVEHAEKEVRHGSVRRGDEVPIALKLALGAAHQHEAQWIMVVW